ncbi:MAG: hypothetical protein CNE99_07580 [OM182 bacterium MED-G24]|uniref:Four-carbon acid sugar kinase N-terminal domain-containing protein n=1 Tax=OM182 bacterium MED-G24 TaxID=1986255 RepID=A0A2A5WP90_9GAMM|nr:MAG: hypothetical protein CNE99_07580 [OM182 bacterium MED-G24]|tara:strand:- start:233 stop:1255 length:1023 start_codon:yes stop_codon:yes gene_type:complete
MTPELFVTADDRTGALEVGGVIASHGIEVPVGPYAADADSACLVVDLDCRQVPGADAASRMLRAHGKTARFRAHKMDSGLRGNWPHEVKALTTLGYRVAVVPSFPDAGRRCVGGVVFVDDVPVLDSPFGNDPFTAPVSNRPVEILEHAGCLDPGIEVWDADDNRELQAAITRCRAEDRVLVGPTGAVGAFADTVFNGRGTLHRTIQKPVLIICGSLNATSRRQLTHLGVPVQMMDGDCNVVADVSVFATHLPDEEVTLPEARNVAMRTAGFVREQLKTERFATLLMIGGDTSAALLGDETVVVIGTVDTGIPVSRYSNIDLVTKGGGIGQPDTLIKLLSE